MRKTVIAGAAAAGAALVGGAAIYYFREKATDEPDYRVLRSEDEFEIRGYDSVIVAEAVGHGPRSEALTESYRLLSDYLTARSRSGEALPMSVPVIQDSGDPMASDPPLFDDDVEGGWRTRFVMPEGRAIGELPDPPEDVELIEIPPRRVAVVSFSGRAGDRLLAEQEDRLRGWLARNGDKAEGEPEYAFYNSPMIPGPLRRNEVWLALD